MTYIVMAKSAKVCGRAKQYGPYSHAALVELQPGFEGCPAMISPRARGVKRVVRDTGAMWSGGKTRRSAWVRACGELAEQRDHLNRMERVAADPITVAEIDAETNEEFRRELIDAFGGLDAYLATAGASVVQTDDAGMLMRRNTAGEPVVAVAVTCPSTGRRYMLRVPPETTTARQGVAWTFGLSAEQYVPSQES